jgi:threonine dehydrogenase-like Zn-dependent dehydrogenase
MSISTDFALDQNHVRQPKPQKVAVLSAPRAYIIQSESRPVCAPGEVLIRLQGCGVCASSIPVWEGRPWFTYPLSGGAPGHEGWGHIVATGEDVVDLQVGQRVACLGDRAYAEHIKVPADHVVPLPPELDDIPFPGEAIGCAMNIFRRSDIRAGQSVAIIGAGFLGLLLIQLLVSAGATVYALSRRASARDLAREFGAAATFDTEDWWGNAQKIVALTGNHGCDRVIEVTGMQFALDTATEMMAEYGKLIIAGFHQDGMRQVKMETWNWRAIDVVNAHERDPRRYVEGMREGVTATAEGRIRPQVLLTHSFALEELDQAFQLMIDRPDGFIKGWIQLSQTREPGNRPCDH